MADSPFSIIKKKTKSRSVRTRDTSPSTSADPPTREETEASPSVIAAKLKKQRAKPKAALSFGGDDEEENGEVFQVKKSKLSRRLKLGTTASSSGLALPDNLDTNALSSSTSVTYNAEYLQELKASTRSAPTTDRLPSASHETDLVLDESEIVGAVIVNEDANQDAQLNIPSESSITAAKQKRERLRQNKSQVGTEDDFISLSVTRREDLYQGPHPESRLMREDDDLGEGDDDFAEYTSAKERIALGKKARKKEAESRRSAIQELINDAEEQDEETLEWEREQLRRGSRRESEKSSSNHTKLEYRPAPIPPIVPLPTLDSAIHRLTESLTQLTTSHSANTSSMTTLADERLALESKEKNMRTMVEEAESKRSWFDSFKEWVETVATFLDEKYPIIERLEEEHISLLKEKKDMVSKRLEQDDDDDLEMIFGSLQSANGEVEELDELGRVVPRQNSAVARKARREERNVRQTRHNRSQEEEGYSTDSSLPPSDEADYQTALDNLGSKVKDVLSDVHSSEFRDPRLGVARWFGNWRDKYSDTYTGAFGGLGMISAWEFWVRLEMIGWDPIANPRTLDSFSWFSALYDYSRPLGSDPDAMDDDMEPELGPDGDLVSAMISTFIPRLCNILKNGAFDCYSAKHIRILVDFAEQVEASSSQEKFEMFLQAVYSKFRESIDGAISAVKPYLEAGGSAKFNPDSVPARRRLLTRRYKLLSNLVRWRKHTGEKFGAGEMMTRLIVECELPVARTGWEVGGEEIVQKCISIVPPEIRRSIAL